VVTLPVVVVVLAVLARGQRGGSIGPAIAVLLGLVLFSFRNWRGPACHGYVGKTIEPALLLPVRRGPPMK
jgi:hypothetical protein